MYDRETVEFVLEVLGEGWRVADISELTGVCEHTIRRWRSGKVPRARPVARPPEEGARPMGNEGPTEREGELYRPPASGPLSGLAPDQIENLLLRAVLADLKAEGWDPASTSNRRKVELGERLRRETGLPLRSITDFLRISKSSYEYHLALLPERRVDPREFFGDEIERIFREEGRCARGYRFVKHVLDSELGEPVSEKVVRDVMRARGLRVVYARPRRRYSSYAGEVDDAPPNLPLRPDGTHDFSAAAPNEKWASDITEFRLPDDPRKVYLSPVVDLFDGKPVAWSIGTSPTAALAEASLEGACAQLLPGQSPTCHTDRGFHYRLEGWKSICAAHGVTRSMSRKGRSCDNAAMEGFFGRLKNEFFYGRDWSGVRAEEFAERLDRWMRYYSEGRLRLFREPGGSVYDTIDGRRRRLGLAV